LLRGAHHHAVVPAHAQRRDPSRGAQALPRRGGPRLQLRDVGARPAGDAVSIAAATVRVRRGADRRRRGALRRADRPRAPPLHEARRRRLRLSHPRRVMDTASHEPEAEVARLTRRVDRERRARLEAEAIAEQATRELYRDRELLYAITRAANEADSA